MSEILYETSSSALVVVSCGDQQAWWSMVLDARKADDLKSAHLQTFSQLFKACEPQAHEAYHPPSATKMAGTRGERRQRLFWATAFLGNWGSATSRWYQKEAPCTPVRSDELMRHQLQLAHHHINNVSPPQTRNPFLRRRGTLFGTVSPTYTSATPPLYPCNQGYNGT